MTLAATFGLLILLAHSQPQGMPATTLLFQAQENPPAQNPPDQSTPSEETKPAQQDKTEPPAQPPFTSPADTPSTPREPIVQPASESPKPKPVAPRKTTTKKSATRKPARKHTHTPKNGVVVVHNGGTSDKQGQISSGTSDQQASQQLKSTNSLLTATASNLEKLSGKQLSPAQQDIVKQIRSYMQQSKDATTAGDVQGANNLALKANLLSQELVKP